MTRDQLIQFHEELTKQARSIVEAKNHDYCHDGDPFSNFRASSVLGIPPEKGLLIRVLDKLKRLQTFIEVGTLKVKTEGPRDAVLDVINYMVLLAAMIEDDRKRLSYIATDHAETLSGGAT